MYKFGYVGIIGRPNAGKSTLTNSLVGEKVAIVSPKPQTTRDNIIGIINGENYQVVLVDTPGVHHSKNKLDKVMMKNVRSALGGVDLILYLIDGSTVPDQEEIDYIEKLRSGEVPILTVKTKSDLKVKDFQTDYTISAKNGDGLAQLMDKILEYLPASEKKNFLYDTDYYTDKSVKFLISEAIREQCLNNFHQEVPHGIAALVTSFNEKNNLTYIDADIVCEEERHKGIIIGKGGTNLKKIGENVRHYAEDLIGNKVMLKLFVRVEKDWRNNPNKLKNLGYDSKS